MRTITSRYDGDLCVDDATTARGTINGDCLVVDGGLLHLYGTITGDLDVRGGGQVELFGTVLGNVVAGGVVTVAGVIHGLLTGSATIRRGAMVSGRRF